MQITRITSHARSGFTLMEAIVATSILVVVLLASFGMLSRDTTLTRSSLGIQVAETRAQQMLHGLERELADARGANPTATLTAGVPSGGNRPLQVDSTLGFPPDGYVIASRGTPFVERIGYRALTTTTFVRPQRGLQCTDPATHPQGGQLIWGGLAEPIEIQTNPAANLYDGRAQVGGRTVFFRGDGTGFSYRVPTDPTGGNDFIDGDDLRWGANVRGTPLETGWYALEFVAKDTYDESITQDDLNHDGDTTDVFDVGQIRRRSWNSDALAATGDHVGLGPSCVIQERCRPGGDLDGDGFDDPMFLWDSGRRELSIRLFVLGRSSSNMPVVRKVETVVFLRNEAPGA